MSVERLNKILAHAGVASRRKCDDIIKTGLVEIDGQIVVNPAEMIDPQSARVAVDGKHIELAQTYYYVLMNKPPQIICTKSDPEGRATVFDLLRHADLRDASLFTVGRLDYMSRGAILLTNDGEFANVISHPRYNILKTYLVTVKNAVEQKHIDTINKGIKAFGIQYAPGRWAIKKAGKNFTLLKIILNEGKNNEIRNICRHFRYTIKDLQRIAVGHFTIADIPEGRYMLISKRDIAQFMKRHTR